MMSVQARFDSPFGSEGSPGMKRSETRMPSNHTMRGILKKKLFHAAVRN